MFRVRKLFRVEMAHILDTAVTAACRETIHGHSYVIEVVLASPNLNADGMVVDFGALAGLKTRLMERYDHALFLPAVLPNAAALARCNTKTRIVTFNPTVENMCIEVYQMVLGFLAAEKADRGALADVSVDRIRIHETESGWAEYIPL